MRVTIDYTAGAQQRAGIGRYTRELVGALARLDQTTEYTLLVRGRVTHPQSTANFPSNFRLRRVPIPDRLLIRLWRAGVPLPADWLAGRADVYYSPDFTLPPLSSGRCVVTVHDLSFLRVPDAADAGLRAYLTRAVPKAVARADAVLADSEHTRCDLIELLNVAATKVSVLYPGVAPRFRRVTDADVLARVRARYGLPGPYILGLGTLEPRKNLRRLIEAFARVRAGGGAMTLALAGGQGWLYDPIYARVEELGLGEAIRFLGYVDDVDLPALYSAAEAFVFPSLYEGFGLPPLEALACGTPVVVSDASSLPEVVGTAGILLPPEDIDAWVANLDRVVRDEGLRARLQAAGPVQAAGFTWEAAAEQLRAVLGELARRPRGR